MKHLTIALWLLSVAAVAFALALLATGLRQDIAHCIGQSGALRLSPAEARAAYPGASLAGALARLPGFDLIVMQACLMPLALRAVVTRGRRQWVAVGATVALGALIGWHLLRDFAGKCAITDRIEIMQYLFPSILALMLAYRLGALIARRAGE